MCTRFVHAHKRAAQLNKHMSHMFHIGSNLLTRRLYAHVQDLLLLACSHTALNFEHTRNMAQFVN